MCLSVLLSVGLSPEVAQTKQTAVFMKQRRATRAFCLVVHFSTHTRTPICSHVHSQMPRAPHLLPAPLCCIPTPCVFCSAQSLALSGPRACSVSQTARNATLPDLSPTTRRGAGLDKRAKGQLQSCACVGEETGVVNSNTHTLILT